MLSKPFFSIGATGSGYNINVNSLSFNSLNTGFVYLGATGLAGIKQIDTDDLYDSFITTSKIADSAVTSAKIASNIHLSGVPTVPTGATGANTTQIANTAFVQNAISNLVNSAPLALNTLSELATALGNDPVFSSTVTTQLSGKAGKTGDEGISGIKTFTSLPECSATPTSGSHITNKTHVDAVVTQTYNQSAKGLTGAQGTTGSQGLTGAQGRGSQGITGTQGITGAQGLVGAQGRGAQGITGAQGFTGGVQGSMGAQGEGYTGISITNNNSGVTMYPVFTTGIGSNRTLSIDNITAPLSYFPNTSTLRFRNLSLLNPITTTNTSAATTNQIGNILTNTGTPTVVLNGQAQILSSVSVTSGIWLVIVNVSLDTTTSGISYSIDIATDTVNINGMALSGENISWPSTSVYNYKHNIITSQINRFANMTSFGVRFVAYFNPIDSGIAIGKITAIKIA